MPNNKKRRYEPVDDDTLLGFREIAEEIGVKKSRAHQIYLKAMRKLAEAAERGEIQPPSAYVD